MNNGEEEQKIRHNESKFRKLFSNLLEAKKNVLQEHFSTSSTGSQFEDEQQLLSRVVKQETINLCFGVGMTASMFALLRYGPRRIIQQLGGGRAQALKQAEIDAKELGTAGVQQRIGKAVNSSITK